MSVLGSLLGDLEVRDTSWTYVRDALAGLRRQGHDFETAWQMATRDVPSGSKTAPDEPAPLDFAKARFELGYYRMPSVSIRAHHIRDDEWEASDA